MAFILLGTVSFISRSSLCYSFHPLLRSILFILFSVLFFPSSSLYYSFHPLLCTILFILFSVLFFSSSSLYYSFHPLLRTILFKLIPTPMISNYSLKREKCLICEGFSIHFLHFKKIAFRLKIPVTILWLPI